MTAPRSTPGISQADSRQALLATLRRQVECLEGLHPPGDTRTISTGSPALDRLLPAGGLARGSLVEYLSPGPGSGAGTLALAAAREAYREGGALVVVDRSRTFYPPAAGAWGIDLARVLLLHPTDDAAQLWALDQALRCPGVAAVYAPCGSFDVRDFRRLQLAAESGGALGVLVRPAQLRGQPTWADVQWDVGQASRQPRKTLRPPRHPAWQLHVALTRCRGGPCGQSIVLELDEPTGLWQEARTAHAPHPVPLPAELAHPARPRRA
jgi:protein ImuA